MSKDLRGWLQQVERSGVVRDVRGAHWEEEIGAITDANAKHRKHTLLFDEIKGYPQGFRVLTGTLLDSARVATTLNLSADLSNVELVKAIRDRQATVEGELDKFRHRYVDDAPLFENVLKGDDIDLHKFPTPKWMKDDGGRYMGTADAVITRDPDSGWVNSGSYRLMLQDEKTLSIFIEAPRHARVAIKRHWDQGERCPVVVSFGHHPRLQIFSGMEVPHGVSELDFAGAMSQEALDVVKGPVTGLPIPADSEIAIEGYIVDKPREEGPFAEFMGYYASGASQSPSIEVEAIYHRDDPIMLGTCAGRPPYDYSYFRCPVRAALIWEVLEKAGVQGVKGVWCHEAGYSRAFTVVSLEQLYGGHARMAGYLASQCRPGAVSGRYVVVVDDDIDPSNLDEVVWAMASRNDPSTGISIIDQTVGTPLDPVAEHFEGKKILEYTSSRAVVFAVKPFEKLVRGEFPKTADPDADTHERVLDKWAPLFEGAG